MAMAPLSDVLRSVRPTGLPPAALRRTQAGAVQTARRARTQRKRR